MKRAILALVLLGGSLLSAQVSFATRIGPPPPPRVLRVRPASPGAGFVWVEGYWHPVGDHYKWRAGYWIRPPYDGAHWVAPHYEGQMFFDGYWDGDSGHFEHDHR